MKRQSTSQKKGRSDRDLRSPQFLKGKTPREIKSSKLPGVLNDSQIGRFKTHYEEVAELPIELIKICPIIPDYRDPTESIHPIILHTSKGYHCIDGWHYIEQAQSEGQSRIRCHIYHITHHSDTELAIRKAAIRVMPQGGKCCYAELVRNTHRLYQVLQDTQDTSDGLVLFTHGGARRGIDFSDSRDNNIRAVLANRLGKSQTTINKYLQHGDGLTDAAMEELIDFDANKKFFEAIQAPKHSLVATQKAGQKDPVAIAEAISNQVMQWLAESRIPDPPLTTEQERPKTERSGHSERPTSSGNLHPTSRPRIPENGPGNSPSPVSAPFPTSGASVAAELKSIGETLINIAEDQELPIPEQIESIQTLVIELSRLLSRLAYPTAPEEDVAGGTN